MLWALMLVGVLAAIAIALVAFVAADRMTASKRRRVQGTPADLGLRYEEIQFLTADRLTLRGWYLESPAARATVVLVHDIEATRGDADRRLLQLQRDYVRRGYSVFAFDLRGHGESAGLRDSLGCSEQLDVQAAVAYVRRRSPRQSVFLHGFGFGAALSLAAAANGTEVAGIIADSPFVSMRSYLRDRWRHMPVHLFVVAAAVARRCFRADMDALQPILLVDRVPAPILFIHNEGDPVVPLAHTLNLAASSLDERDRVWVVPQRKGHATGYREAPEMYMRHCLEFLDDAVPARVLAAQAV